MLGTINYLSRFAPNLAEVTSPLRELLAKEELFSWDAPQKKAFAKVKEMLTTDPVLAYYNPEVEITLQVDASKYGIGATILQHDKPVAYASKSLTAFEIQYAQIEKECWR